MRIDELNTAQRANDGTEKISYSCCIIETTKHELCTRFWSKAKGRRGWIRERSENRQKTESSGKKIDVLVLGWDMHTSKSVRLNENPEKIYAADGLMIDRQLRGKIQFKVRLASLNLALNSIPKVSLAVHLGQVGRAAATDRELPWVRWKMRNEKWHRFTLENLLVKNKNRDIWGLISNSSAALVVACSCG